MKSAPLRTMSEDELKAARQDINRELNRRKMIGVKRAPKVKNRAFPKDPEGIYAGLPSWARAAIGEASFRHGVKTREALGDNRTDAAVAARWDAWRAMRARGWSYHRIASAFQTDHATVRNGVLSGEPRRLKSSPEEGKVAA